MASNFDYSERGLACAAALQRVNETFRYVNRRSDASDPHTKAWRHAIADWHRALAASYPDGFWEGLEQLDHDLGARDEAIAFLEADPMFYRSGYTKSKVLRRLRHCPLTSQQRSRLRQVILSVVRKRNTYEFADYCRLARRLNNAELRADLEIEAARGSSPTARRAGWMLERLRPGSRLKGPPLGRRAVHAALP